MNTSSTLLEFKHVRKDFAEMVVLRDVDFSIEKGEMVGLVGPSGCGKSTILNIAGCIDEATSGEVFHSGECLQKMSKDETTKLRRRDIGFIFQHFHLVESMTVSQNIEFPLFMLGVGTRERGRAVREVLKALDIEAIQKHSVTQISGGQKQRTAIARALVKKPKIIIADEPTASLDKKNSDLIFSQFRELLKTMDIGLVMASHDQKALGHMHRVIELDKGEIQNIAVSS